MGKGVKERASFCVEYRCAALKILTNVGHQMRLNFPFHRSPFTSPTGERRATFTDGQPRQTYFAHSYLPRENKRSSVCRGALLGGTMFSSSRSRCWPVFPLKSCFVEQPLSAVDSRPGVVEMRSGPRTAPQLGGRARAANFPLAGETKRIKVGLKKKKKGKHFDTNSVNNFNDVMASSGVPL